MYNHNRQTGARSLTMSCVPHPYRNSPIKFRVVTENPDIPIIVKLARAAHEESRFSYIPFSPQKVARLAKNAIADDSRQGVFIAEIDNTPVGFAYCTLGEYHIGADALLATIHNINVSRDVRHRLCGGRAALGLFNGAKSWARARGAVELLLHVTSGVSLRRTHHLAKRLGYTTIGGSYSIRL